MVWWANSEKMPYGWRYFSECRLCIDIFWVELRIYWWCKHWQHGQKTWQKKSQTCAMSCLSVRGMWNGTRFDLRFHPRVVWLSWGTGCGIHKFVTGLRRFLIRLFYEVSGSTQTSTPMTFDLGFNKGHFKVFMLRFESFYGGSEQNFRKSPFQHDCLDTGVWLICLLVRVLFLNQNIWFKPGSKQRTRVNQYFWFTAFFKMLPKSWRLFSRKSRMSPYTVT